MDLIQSQTRRRLTLGVVGW